MDTGDDRYCSHVGVDPLIALPTKADNRTKTQGTQRGLYGPICVYVCAQWLFHLGTKTVLAECPHRL